ncbi:hypothetical protein E4U58_002058, partial [Claviceps cyperi]
MNGVGTSTNRSRSTNKALGKNSKAGLFCSFKSSASDPPKFKLKWMAEIKSPHKMEAEVFQMALPHGHVIDLREGILGDNEGQKTVIEIIIQLYSAMVDKGTRYGYTDTGKATLYIRIGSDPSIVYYHLSCPSSDVDDDDRKMHLSAVSQRLAFTVQAIQAPDSSLEWVTEAEKLPQWKYEREDVNDSSSDNSPKEARDLSARRPAVVEYERDPFHTRLAARKRPAAEVEPEEEALDSVSGLPNHSAEEVENEEEASDFDSVSDKRKMQNLGMHKRPDGR